jgi:hypothetical protein
MCRSVQQTLNPPDEFLEQNYFGKILDLDRSHLRQLAASCVGCNSSFTNSGSVFVYEPLSPDAKKWSQTAMLTLSPNDDLLGLSNSHLRIHKDLIVTDARNSDNTKAVIFHRRMDGDWSQQQVLSLGSSVADTASKIELYDETIVIAASLQNGGAGAIHVFYPVTEPFSGTKSKPAPLQWSEAQVLQLGASSRRLTNSIYNKDNGGWQLVRRVKAGPTWHPATDHLAGTDTYGTYNADPTADATFSIAFDTIDFDQFMFATGDGEKWLIATKDAVVGTGPYGLTNRPILKSSDSCAPYSAQWLHRDWPEDPWISLTDHIAASSTQNILYGGDNYGPGHPHADVLSVHNGANVFIRKAPASTPGCDEDIIQSIAVGGNLMLVGDSNGNGFLYSRPAGGVKGQELDASKLTHMTQGRQLKQGGMWSLQQRLQLSATATDAVADGSSMFTVFAGGVEYWDETESWDCLLVSVEDHFNDGWDSANLIVDVPGGEKDSFATRCDSSNPLQFRYCPSSKEDSGLYKFSIPDGVKAKFYWEIVWRVYEESTGNWYTGNWDTKMDFEWDSGKTEFRHKKIERELPNNITCKECRQKPVAKRSALRDLKAKDYTVHPTISPAPTIATTTQEYPWQELKLITTGADWFDAQHKGTSYYISDKHGHRLLSTGTLCPWERNPSTKTCWEDHPDGEYILRVGGALDRVQTHTFKFCNSENEITAQTQLIFRVENGECEIVSNVKSAFYCSGVKGLTQVSSAQFRIAGVSGTLGSVEYSQIAAAIASVLPGVGAGDVQVQSAIIDGDYVLVTAQIAAGLSAVGIDINDVTTLDAYEAKTAAALSNNGALTTALASSEVNSNIHLVQGVSLVSFKLLGNGEVNLHMNGDPEMVTDFAFTSNAKTSGSDNEALLNVVSYAGYIFATMGVLLIGLVAFIRVRRSSDNDRAIVSTDEISTMEMAIQDNLITTGPKQAKHIALAGKALPVDVLKKIIEEEDSALESMLRNNPQL